MMLSLLSTYCLELERLGTKIHFFNSILKGFSRKKSWFWWTTMNKPLKTGVE